jgi:hypothetical protein
MLESCLPIVRGDLHRARDGAVREPSRRERRDDALRGAEPVGHAHLARRRPVQEDEVAVDRLALRCRSHGFLDVAAMASVSLLIAAFFAHVVDPAPGASARAATPSAVVAVAQEACYCPPE